MKTFSEKLPAKTFLQRVKDPEKVLSEYEEVFSLKIPERLREILIEYSGAISFEKPVKFKPLNKTGWEDQDGRLSVPLILGPADNDFSLTKNKLTFADRLPDHMAPFCELDGGNLLCFDNNEKIYFWDHEAPPDQKNLFLVSGSFEEFEDALTACEETPSGGNRGLISFKLNL